MASDRAQKVFISGGRRTRLPMCRGQRQQIFYLWRPKLRDPKDDMVLELAMNAGADAIVRHNVRNYVAAQGMGPAMKGERRKAKGERLKAKGPSTTTG